MLFAPMLPPATPTAFVMNIDTDLPVAAASTPAPQFDSEAKQQRRRLAQEYMIPERPMADGAPASHAASEHEPSVERLPFDLRNTLAPEHACTDPTNIREMFSELSSGVVPPLGPGTGPITLPPLGLSVAAPPTHVTHTHNVSRHVGKYHEG
jgi:hypothetical protein